MSNKCPVCGEEAQSYIKPDNSFKIDTIGSIPFCVSEEGLFIHKRGSKKDTPIIHKVEEKL